MGPLSGDLGPLAPGPQEITEVDLGCTWLDRHSEVGKIKMTNHVNAWLHGRERRRHTTPLTRARHVFAQGFTGKEPVCRNSWLFDFCEFWETLTLLWPKWHKLLRQKIIDYPRWPKVRHRNVRWPLGTEAHMLADRVSVSSLVTISLIFRTRTLFRVAQRTRGGPACETKNQPISLNTNQDHVQQRCETGRKNCISVIP